MDTRFSENRACSSCRSNARQRASNTAVADPHDANAYPFGRIGDHNVVIACLPAETTGKVSAATVAIEMMRSFPSIRFGLMVGTGGGVLYLGSQRQAMSANIDEDDCDDSGDGLGLG